MSEVNGTLIWFYYICKREVWLMSHNILPNQHDNNIEYGRFIHEYYYNKKEKEILFGNTKFDVLYQKNNKLIIGETKKSSAYLKPSEMQLLFYLKTLKESKIDAIGEINIPEEKKKFKIELDELNIKELIEAENNIVEIMNKEKPDSPLRINFCKKCGYSEYCWG
ncbi:CRISPR-associated protein Cas4 [Oceanotoga sp. DSM 15011]|jgi:CRISPR-associated exonuclease Cas4|uniref:CRISPR-associated protein Cas4 n=1 Tax=Oceanotoga sp. DSM 15011 TaxID=2984951 RepID=UPI0021F45F41|nr:CRISPR-associated protein Cas4 [Oceanotoga sp. DSM 15011]UYP01356.1 CRISPR-associated protein Cas4 [Oceanotoga sp. DSM 15011]